MDIQDLKPIITLLTSQEERLSSKIREVHNDVKDLQCKSEETNRNIIKMELTYLPIVNSYSKSEKLLKLLSKVQNKPGKSILILSASLMVLITAVTVILDTGLEKRLLDFIKLFI